MKSVFNPPMEDVLKVLLDSEIYDRITDDTDPPKEKLGKANLSGWNIIAGYKEEIASLFMVKDRQLHFYVLPQFRKYAREFLKQALKMYGQSVFCEIPTLYPETINFAKRSGFIESGIRRNAHMKNGKQYDLVRLEWAV
jgi:hypothetical protein